MSRTLRANQAALRPDFIYYKPIQEVKQEAEVVWVTTMELDEVIFEARQLLKERIDSLRKGVRYCILQNKGTPDWPAPLPALLYCFSTIDLLGALYGGDATKNAKTTKQARDYMIDFMSYPEDKVELIQKVFRHNIVHLAQLKPETTIDSSIIKKRSLSSKIKSGSYKWAYCHKKRRIHLKLEEEKPNEFRFHVSIWSLVEDIADSVFGPNGYLQRLGNNEDDLQEKLKTAYGQIFKV